MQDNLLYILFESECFKCNKCNKCTQMPCVCNKKLFGSVKCETDTSHSTEPNDKPVSSISMRRTSSVISDLSTGKVASIEKLFTHSQPLTVETQNILFYGLSGNDASCATHVPTINRLDQTEAQLTNNVCSRCNYLSQECKCITERYGPYLITHTKSFDDVRNYRNIRDSHEYKIRMANKSLRSTGSGGESNSNNYNRKYSRSSNGGGDYSNDAFGYAYM